MDRPGHQSLAGAGLPLDQGGQFGPGHLLDLGQQQLQIGALADEVARRAARPQHLGQGRDPRIRDHRQLNLCYLRIGQIPVHGLHLKTVGPQGQVAVFHPPGVGVLPGIVMSYQSVAVDHGLRAGLETDPVELAGDEARPDRDLDLRPAFVAAVRHHGIDEDGWRRG